MIGPYLVDKITHTQEKGRADTYGTPNTRRDVSRKARIDYKNRNVVNAEGEIVVSMAKVLIRPLTIIRNNFSTRATNTSAYEDIITFDGTDHAILAIGKVQDFSTKFMEIWVA